MWGQPPSAVRRAQVYWAAACADSARTQSRGDDRT